MAPDTPARRKGPLSQPPRVIPARLVRAGDFTMFSGFRHVASVEHHWTSSDARRKAGWASHFQRVELVRVDGTTDAMPPGEAVTVYSERWAAHVA